MPRKKAEGTAKAKKPRKPTKIQQLRTETRDNIKKHKHALTEAFRELKALGVKSAKPKVARLQ